MRKNSKQIMTGLEGNRQIYLPREIQDRLPKSFYDLACVEIYTVLNITLNFELTFKMHILRDPRK